MKEDTLAGLIKEKKQAEKNIELEQKRIEGIRERANELISEMRSEFDAMFDGTAEKRPPVPRAPHGSTAFLAGYLLRKLGYPVVIPREKISEVLRVTDRKHLDKILVAFFKNPVIRPMSPGVKGTDFIIREGVTIDAIEKMVSTFEAEVMTGEELLVRYYGAIAANYSVPVIDEEPLKEVSNG